MKIIYKILSVTIILQCIISNLTFADNSDCWSFWSLSYKQESKSKNWFNIVDSSWETTNYWFSNFLTIQQQRDIITKDDLNTALLNLKKYCCEKELWWLTQRDKTCQDDAVFFNENALDSKYLFDHLFDVIMRRLNWLTWSDDIYIKSNMTVDELWNERRNRITQQAENISGANPQIILSEYKKFWNTSDPNLWYNITTQTDATFWDLSDQDFLTYISWQWSSEDSVQVANALKKYKERTLYDRYNNVCSLTQYFYSLLDVWIHSQDRARTIQRLSNNLCKKAVKQQIESENNYVKTTIQNSSNLFLSNYIKWYIEYLQNRQQNLESTEKNITDRLLDIVRAVPHLVKTCVK